MLLRKYNGCLSCIVRGSCKNVNYCSLPPTSGISYMEGLLSFPFFAECSSDSLIHFEGRRGPTSRQLFA